jgi:hypothetical protein
MNKLDDDKTVYGTPMLVEGTVLTAKQDVSCGDFIIPEGKEVRIIDASDAIRVSIVFYLGNDDIADEDDVQGKVAITWSYLELNFIVGQDDKDDEELEDESASLAWEGCIEAENITTKIHHKTEQIDPSATFYELHCADCGAIQTFRLDCDGLSLIKSIHQC